MISGDVFTISKSMDTFSYEDWILDFVSLAGVAYVQRYVGIYYRLTS